MSGSSTSTFTGDVVVGISRLLGVGSGNTGYIRLSNAANGSFIGYNGSQIYLQQNTTGYLQLGSNNFTVNQLGTATAGGAVIGLSSNSTSGNLIGFVVTSSYSQSSATTANTDFLVNRTQTVVGSGAQYLIEARTNNISQFNVSNVGGIVANSMYISSSASGSLFVSGSSSFTGSLNVSGSITTTGTLTAQTLVVQVITSSIEYSSGSNIFGSKITDTQIMTGSVNITGSLTLVGPEVISGSLSITGSNTLIGTKTITGSVFISGSKTIVGTNTITGSFNVTGSTTQVGNLTQTGSVIISGSFTVSGSKTGGANPSIGFDGSVRFGGYARFEPVTLALNNSISASYIYASGSTNDLYFTQNTAGYANTTRLRWLEGNLYTGLLNGGLITTQSSTVYQVSSGSGIIVSLNASLNNDPYPTTQYLNWGNLSQSISNLSASYDQQFVGIDSTGNIYAQGTPLNDGQLDTIIQVGVVLHQNHSTINGIATQPQTAYGLKQNESVFINAFGPLKLSGYTLAASGSSTGSLVVASGTAYVNGGNYLTDPNNPSYIVGTGATTSRIFRYYDSGSGTNNWAYDTNNGAGYGAIDPKQYSNNGVLTAVPGGGTNRQWSIQRVFFFPTSPLSPKPIVVYYGNATYTTQADAIANVPFEAFVEAPNTAANAIYLGSLIVRNDANFTNTATYSILAGGLFRQTGGSGGGGSVVTQTLAGLSDVNITSPTNLQPLAYDTATGKWINTSAISASIVGNATTATSASYAPDTTFPYTGSAIISGSLGVTGSFSVSGSSIFSGTISGSQPANNPSSSLLLISGSINPTGSAGTGSAVLLNTVMSASANNQALIGLDINPTFTNGAFTGVQNYGLRIVPRGTNQIALGGTNNAGFLQFARGTDGSFQGSIGYVTSTTSNDFVIGSGGGSGILGFSTVATRAAQFFSSGNFTLQNGGTFTDNGYRLQVNASGSQTALFVSGSTSLSGSLNVSGSITTTGTLTAQTLVVSIISSSIEYSSGSNIFGSQITNTQTMTGSVNITGSLNVVGPLTLVSASLNYQQNLSIASGSTQVIASAATGTYYAAFFDYAMYSASIVRAGTVMTTWSGSTTSYNEAYTADLGGSTAGVTLQTAISGSNIQLQATASSAAWVIRSLVRLI
jgi:hypothetical protein